MFSFVNKTAHANRLSSLILSLSAVNSVMKEQKCTFKKQKCTFFKEKI
ncbi:hypothetical protein F7D08_0215 [Bifidobacterium cebidarum]|uniref:Uncharacterized protein n=1 Tax=Bifidobacterium cebidarum TaxID=2650773 RepID=A0A6I1GCB3_9BIFI|nr:hypothetical protein F7D08_0215 [Bifidobacterium cebidarum]